MVTLMLPSASSCSLAVYPCLRASSFARLDGVSLQELVQPLGVTPAAVIVVVPEFARFEFADDRVFPVAKLDATARFLGTVTVEMFPEPVRRVSNDCTLV